MPTVTRLERQARNKERVNIYLDGEFAFGLFAVDAVALREGQTLAEEDVRRLQNKDAIDRAVERAVRALARRPYSIAELRRLLSRKDPDEAIVSVAIERLESLGYVDDLAFAQYWIESRMQFKPRGASALRYELRQKGVADAIITQLISQIVDESAGAYEAARKRARRHRGTTRKDFTQQMGAYLQRKGFAYGVIREALNRLMEELTEEDSGFFAPSE